MRTRITFLLDMNEVDIFKFWYEHFVFELLSNFNLEWKQELAQINVLWDEVCKMIDTQRFLDIFTKHCNELNMDTSQYNFEEFFLKAKSEWRGELMTKVINKIIIFYNDHVPIDAAPAHWNGTEIVIDRDVYNCDAIKILPQLL